MAVVLNSRSKPLIASSFRQYPRLPDVSFRKEGAKEREREREGERVVAGPRMRERKSNEKICMYVCIYIYLRSDESRFTREFSVYFYS